MLCNPKIDATAKRAKILIAGHTSHHQTAAPLEPGHLTAKCLKYWASLAKTRAKG